MYTGYIDTTYGDELYSLVSHIDFPWKLVKDITGKEEEGPGLVHLVIKEDGIVTSNEVLDAVKKAIMSNTKYKVEDIYRIKINCLLKNSENVVYNNKHIDQNFDHNVMIIYLNDSDGDTILYSGDEIIERSSPEKNKFIIFNGLINHASTRPVINTYRYIVNINFQPSDDFIIDNIKEIVINQSHSDRELFDHLYGTYLILKKLGAPRYIMLAGLCHSIYGTSTYNNQTVSIQDRNKIKSIIGPEAEELAFMFSSIDRTPESYKKIENQKQHDLLLIEYANLIDQNFNREHSNIINSIMHRITKLQRELKINAENY